MIRIDEIYNNTFWPWIDQNLPLTRLFFMDPFGSTDPIDLKNFGHDTIEQNYIFMHDQEPVDISLYRNLFNEVVIRNLNLQNNLGPKSPVIITSERESDNLDRVCLIYKWHPFYYFFHGWASLDWYRGYDKTFLLKSPEQRQISHSYLLPNRIVGGQRDHRLLLIYHIAKRGNNSALISCPDICPQERQSVFDIAKKFQDRYGDIQSTLAGLNLPWHMPNENNHPMTSCWLDLFDESGRCLAYVTTETVYFGRRKHLTEKTFKPICLGMPFILVSAAGSLRYLRQYGFRSFGEFWDESYDDETDDFKRLEKIADLLQQLDRMPQNQQQDLYRAMIPTIRHNHEHFYGGCFEKILWKEFTSMLDDLKKFLA